MLVPVVNYEGLYSVTEDGRVYSYKSWRGVTGRWLKPGRAGDGYIYVNLYRSGEGKTHKVHRLVAQAFIPNPFSLPQINHKNGIKDDNRVGNLEWCNSGHNMRHAYAVLGRKPSGGHSHRAVVGIHIKTGERVELPSLGEAAHLVKGSVQNIWLACQGKIRTAYGYRWCYLDSVVS